jgi:D-alanyl-D-alanine carboxypeptidase
VLHWTDTLAQLFPEAHADYATVTLDQLLQHRSGLPASANLALMILLDSDASDHGRAKFATAALAVPHAHAAGTFEYSNTNYIVAAAALEARTNMSWDQLIRDELWTPLHMSSCGLGAPGAASLDQPWGHTVSLVRTTNDPWQSSRHADAISPQSPGADNPAGLGPAGTVHCSLRDWGKFLDLVLRGARHEKTELLSVAAFDHLLTPPAGGDYMGGWLFADRPWAGGRALNHAGSNTMWFANTWLAPQKRLVVAVVENVFDEATGEAVIDALVERYAK